MKKIYVDEKTGRKKVVTIIQGPSMTDQQYKEECDVNNIISKYRRTGSVTHIAQRPGSYADVSEVKDLHQSLIFIENVKKEFMNLSSKIRRRFNNSIQDFYAFMQDPENYDEAVKLGLIKADKEESGPKPKDSAATKPEGRGSKGKEVSNGPTKSKKDTQSDSADS